RLPQLSAVRPRPLPTWPVPANDPDYDGFSSGVESSAGANPLAHCGPNAWPADVNNDAFSDITGVSALTANFGLAVPPAPARQNIAPDPSTALSTSPASRGWSPSSASPAITRQPPPPWPVP